MFGNKIRPVFAIVNTTLEYLTLRVMDQTFYMLSLEDIYFRICHFGSAIVSTIPKLFQVVLDHELSEVSDYVL